MELGQRLPNLAVSLGCQLFFPGHVPLGKKVMLGHRFPPGPRYRGRSFWFSFADLVCVSLKFAVFLGALLCFGKCSGARLMQGAWHGKSNGGWRPLGFVQNGVWESGAHGKSNKGKTKSTVPPYQSDSSNWIDNLFQDLCIPSFVGPSWKCREVAF